MADQPTTAPAADLAAENRRLQAELERLRVDLNKKTMEAGSLAGQVNPLRKELRELREWIAKNDNIKELDRLKIELSNLTSQSDKLRKRHLDESSALKESVTANLSRALRAESKFAALEGTAAMMCKERDNANASAAALLAERDKAIEKSASLQLALDEATKELVELRAAAAKTGKKEPALAKA